MTLSSRSAPYRRCQFFVSCEALSIAVEQARLRGADVALFNLLAAQRAVARLRLNRMRYRYAIKRDSESIGRWYRRYFGVGVTSGVHTSVYISASDGARNSCSSRSLSTNTCDARRRVSTSAVRVAGQHRGTVERHRGRHYSFEGRIASASPPTTPRPVEWRILLITATVTKGRQWTTSSAAIVDMVLGLVWTALPEGHVDFLNQRWCEYTVLSVAEAFYPIDMGVYAPKVSVYAPCQNGRARGFAQLSETLMETES
jgi:hypothetical protein